MFDRTRSFAAVRLLAGATVVALAVAACGGSSNTPSPAASAAAPTAAVPEATPAPTAAPEQPSASAQAGGGSTSAGCADPKAVAEALKNADHYIATAKIAAAIPGSSEAPGSSGLSLSLDMTMKYQKPDRLEISSGMGLGTTLFAMKQIGKDSWISMFGSDTWSKADSATGTGTGTEGNPFGNSLDASGLQPLAQIPTDIVLPGDSSCVIGYSMQIPDLGAGDSSNPLSSLSGATAFVMRVDTSTNLPQSMGFSIDTAKAGMGAPTSMVFAFDYQTPVDIQAPDPSKVTAGGGLGGFPFPSGMELPSGFPLPSGMTQP